MNEMAWDDLLPVQEQLRLYALQIEDDARQKERQRIARDLHDSLGHALTALNVQLQTAVKLWKLDPAKAELFLVQAQRLGSTAIQEVRQSVSSLRSVAADLPLEVLIESLVEDFRQVTDVAIATHIDLPAVPQEVTSTLYRIVQEALTNIRKYAAATAVQVQLKPTLNGVQLTIVDNGAGFCLDTNPKGFGLRGMAERVAALSGQFHIQAQPGAGCQIQVELPLQQSMTEAELGPDFISSNLTVAGSSSCLGLSPEQFSCLETVLAEYIGLIAPTLIQQVMAQVLSYPVLVEKLTLYIPAAQRSEFKQRVKFLLDSSAIKPANLRHLPNSSNQLLDEHFINQCEGALTIAIGPIAPLIVQQALESSPQTLAELIETLAAKLPDAQAAAEFQRYLGSWNN